MLSSNGAVTEDILRARISADVIVDPNADPDIINHSSDAGIGGVKIVNNLQDALFGAKDGDKIFLEEGRYYREEGFSVSSRVSISGANSGGCVLVSNGRPTLQICAGKNLSLM